jgi:hypothetical protein
MIMAAAQTHHAARVFKLDRTSTGAASAFEPVKSTTPRSALSGTHEHRVLFIS